VTRPSIVIGDVITMAATSSKTVNQPTDVKFKEQNVNDKLQLYGIWSAFASGKVPSVRISPCRIAADGQEQTN
jgi:hypothetical protein